MPSILNRQPDHTILQSALRREACPRLPLYEFFSDGDVQDAAVLDWPQNDVLPQGGNPHLNAHIRRQYYLGYDYLSPWAPFGFDVARKQATDISGMSHGFLDDTKAPIRTREDLDRYVWPTPGSISYSDVEYCSAHLPEGMKLVCNLGSGLLEWGMWLMGSEHFCTSIYDDPELVAEVLRRVNEQQVAVSRQAASHPDVIACAMGDDMGFRTQTFVSPKFLREMIFPGLRRISDAIHLEGKQFILHVCGNINSVMDDLLRDVGPDAKHSFEDEIMPVTAAKEQFGDRVALLGGIDMDKLCRLPLPELESYIRSVVAICAPGGGYALGSGNSIPNYVPPAALRLMCEMANK